MVGGNSPEQQGPGDKFQEEYRTRLARASLGMLNTMYDVVDSLTLNMPESMRADDKGDVERGLMVLQTFLDSDMVLVIPRPRIPRAEDRVDFLPGQHKGVSIEFVSKTGEIANFNMYGGLRDTGSVHEMRDTDVSMGRHHSIRTDRILSQPVHLNWHVIDPRLGVLTDVWLQYHLNRAFQFSKFIQKGNAMNLGMILDASDPRFPELNGRFNNYAKTLITYVPSA